MGPGWGKMLVGTEPPCLLTDDIRMGVGGLDYEVWIIFRLLQGFSNLRFEKH